MDPATNAALATFLQSSGPWGAIVLLIGVVTFLYRRNSDLQDKLNAMGEKRVQEGSALAGETATGLAKSTTSIASLTMATETGNRLLQDIKDILRTMPAGMEGMSRQLEAVLRQVDGNAQRIERLADKFRDDRA